MTGHRIVISGLPGVGKTGVAAIAAARTADEVAATAQRAGLTVLTVDQDFDLIAEITGQPVETLALV